MVKVVQADPVSDEQAALAASIAAADASVFTVQAAVGEHEDDDDIGDWADIPRLAGELVTAAFPECEKAFSEKACVAWGKRADQVAKKWGFDGDGLPPEAMLLFSSLGFVVPVMLAIKTRKQQAIEAAKTPQNAPA